MAAAIVYKYLFSPYRGKMTVDEATTKMSKIEIKTNH
jgi:hypothetical protein